MRDAECVPEDDIGVYEVLCRVGFDPGGDTLGGFARGLWDVAACGVDLAVVVFVYLLAMASSMIQEG